MVIGSFLVIGGGLVGSAAALRLRDAGFAVTLIDPGDPRRGASFGNAGHLATEQVEPLASWRTLAGAPARLSAFGGPLDFRLRDLPFWAPWAAGFLAASRPSVVRCGTAALSALLGDAIAAWQRLAELAEAPSLIQPLGHVVVWMSARAAERGRAAWARTPIGSAGIRELDGPALEHIGSALRRPPAAGIRFTGTGQVSDPQAMRDALLARFAALGGRIVAAGVRTIRVEPGRVAVVLDRGGDLDADAALVAAGAWSGPLMRQLGARVPLVAERGYSIQSTSHEWPDDLPPVVFEERSMVVSRFSSGLRATSFLEIGRPDAPADAGKWRRLQQHLAALGIAFAALPDRWCGPRPTLPDYLPAIGRLGDQARILYAFGHQHLGLTLAAVTAELVQALATRSKPAIDLRPFRIERFG